MSFNTATSILSAVFSEDVGAALVSQTTEVSGNIIPLGESLWTDGAYTGNAFPLLPGVFPNALDIRNDNSGGNLTISNTTYSYNSATYTATWNLLPG